MAPAEFGDYFVRGAFQRDQYKGPKKLLFLHGGIHLVRTRAGEVKKRAAPAGQNLLDTFPAAFNDGSVPLFVSEGKSADKLGAIRRSEYLSFALEQLREAQEPLVVFGHSLDAQFDQHVVDAINQSPTRLVAVSIRRASKQRVEQQQHDLLSRINKQMSFFDAATHPLGDDHMKVTPTT